MLLPQKYLQRRTFKLLKSTLRQFSSNPGPLQKQEIEPSRSEIEMQRPFKSALEKIKGSGDLEDQRTRVLAFGDELFNVDKQSEDYWAIQKELYDDEKEKVPGYTTKEWREQVWDQTKPPTDPIFDKRMKVYGMGDGLFQVNNYWVPGAIIVFPNRFYMWPVSRPEEVKPHTLEILNFVKPRPEYLIVGIGKSGYQFHPAFIEHFESMGMKVDIVQTFEACATFNSCIDDDMNVACALLPPNY